MGSNSRKATQGTEAVVWLQATAPAKPSWGTACNGCGVCCAAEPCALGMLLSRRRRGACNALVWADRGRYECGALTPPNWLPRALRGLWRRAVWRWIAAGQGCDCSLQAHPTRH